MKIFLALWFVPLALFWGWYGLSAYDLSFGFHFLSRDVHDLVFRIYANMLSMEPEVVPGLVAGACILDSIIVLAIAAFKWRSSWLPQAKQTWAAYWGDETQDDEAGEFSAEYSSVGRAHPAE